MKGSNSSNKGVTTYYASPHESHTATINEVPIQTEMHMTICIHY